MERKYQSQKIQLQYKSSSVRFGSVSSQLRLPSLKIKKELGVATPLKGEFHILDWFN